MSYLANGSTHRSMFRLMPPLHHDADPNRSQVVAHIMANMQCDIGRAIAAFASMRNPKSRVLVYDHIHRMWKGCDWQPSDEDSAKGMVLSELRALQRRVAAMDSELRKATKEIKRLSKKSPASRSKDDSDESSDGYWTDQLKKALGTEDSSLKSMINQAWS